MAPLRVAVVGVGHLGRHHARIYSTLDGCRLTTVADLDAARAREVARQYGTEASEDWRPLVGRVDLVSVAVPTERHAEVAVPFLRAGAAVLVEKPMAPNVEQAEEILDAARSSGALLGVGHTERFNPAVEALAQRARSPRFIEAHRLGSFAPRSLDIDVVLDLMIHDLDLALWLAGGPVRSVAAVGVHALTPRVDIANARLVFASGCVANLTASRISATRTRKVRVFQRDSYLSCDCAARSLEHFRLDPAREPGGGPTIAHEQVEIAVDEPLRRELACFAAAAGGGAPYPVGGEAGLEALRLALDVARKIALGQEAPSP